jgi:hypothetical protein
MLGVLGLWSRLSGSALQSMEQSLGTPNVPYGRLATQFSTYPYLR